MIGLSDAQLKLVMAAAGGMPVEKRSQFLERIAAMLRLRGRGHFNDSDVSGRGKIGVCWTGARELERGMRQFETV
jgi:hypothetical protein